MKKIILTTLISFGLAIAANAQKKDHHDRHKDHDREYDRHEKYDKHKSYDRNDYRSHKGYSNHGSHYGNNYSYTTQRVWVQGCSKRVWVPPQYEYVRQHCGRVIRVCVSQGYYRTVQSPGYYTYKRVKTYTPYRRCNNSGLSIYWRF